MAETELKVGERVRLVKDVPHAGYFKGTVRVVQDKAGKRVGVELDEPAIGGHDLDGRLDAAVSDDATGNRMGRGWWTLPENVEKE